MFHKKDGSRAVLALILWGREWPNGRHGMEPQCMLLLPPQSYRVSLDVVRCSCCRQPSIGSIHSSLLLITPYTIYPAKYIAETILICFVRLGVRSIVRSLSVCFSVCLSARLTQKLLGRSLPDFLCMLPVARSIESFSWMSDIYCLSSSECTGGDQGRI